MNVYDHILRLTTEHLKGLAVLIDPDKADDAQITTLCTLFNGHRPDAILVGGSLVNNDTTAVVETLKRNTAAPIVLFPGNATQITPKADAMLLLSLISGRNPEFLVGQHVSAAMRIRTSGLETIPTGYMLIDGGTPTSVQYISSTLPIPADKDDIAVATAVAGQMLGLRAIYLEAGSGARQPVNPRMIQAVSRHIDIPLIVGGGLRTEADIEAACRAGADMVVVGTALERDPGLYTSVYNTVHRL